MYNEQMKLYDEVKCKTRRDLFLPLMLVPSSVILAGGTLHSWEAMLTCLVASSAGVFAASRPSSKEKRFLELAS